MYNLHLTIDGLFELQSHDQSSLISSLNASVRRNLWRKGGSCI